MICPNCKSKLPKSTYTFCTYCGYDLNMGSEKTLTIKEAYDMYRKSNRRGSFSYSNTANTASYGDRYDFYANEEPYSQTEMPVIYEKGYKYKKASAANKSAVLLVYLLSLSACVIAIILILLIFLLLI